MKIRGDPGGRPGLRAAGLVAAGFPSPAEEELRDIVSLDEYLVPRPCVSFVLRVSGDAMRGAGIMPGDLVIVERGRPARNGDIVVAEADGETVMRYFRREGGRVRLEAADDACPPLAPRGEVRLLGVVGACIRKYKL